MTIRERFRTLLDETNGDGLRAVDLFVRHASAVEELDTDQELAARITAMALAEFKLALPEVALMMFEAASEAAKDEGDFEARFQARLRQRRDPREHPESTRRSAREITMLLVWSVLFPMLGEEYAAWLDAHGIDSPERERRLAAVAHLFTEWHRRH